MTLKGNAYLKLFASDLYLHLHLSPFTVCPSPLCLIFCPHLFTPPSLCAFHFYHLPFTLCPSPFQGFSRAQRLFQLLFPKAFQSLFFQRLLPGAFPWPCSDPLFPEGSPRRLFNPLQTAFQKAQELSKKAFTKPLPRSSKFFSQGCSRGQRPFQGCSPKG